jgi:hypothetical protein
MPPASPRQSAPAPAAAAPSAAAQGSERIQRAVEDAAEGTPAPPPEQAAAADALRAAESATPSRNAPASAAPSGVNPPAAPPPVQRASETTSGQSGRPTLPDAPTLLEPAAPQGLADTIQRAIAAAETPGRAADVPPDAPASSAPEGAQPPSARPAPVVLDSRLTPSPWSSFMQAPEAKPEPAPRRPPPAPKPVGRAAAPQPPALPAPPTAPDGVQRALAEPEAALPLQEIDLAQALAQAEGSAPEEGARSQPAPARASGSPATPTGVQRKTVSGPVVEGGDDQLPPPSVVPAPGSVEAAMLDLLNLPPDTSVYGLKSGGKSPAPTGQGPTVQRQPLDQALAGSVKTQGTADVQRAEAANEMADSPSSENPNADGQGGEPDVDDLARKVYRLLKDKLRVERERSTR